MASRPAITSGERAAMRRIPVRVVFEIKVPPTRPGLAVPLPR
jgi:hypothetical protein